MPSPSSSSSSSTCVQLCHFLNPHYYCYNYYFHIIWYDCLCFFPYIYNFSPNDCFRLLQFAAQGGEGRKMKSRNENNSNNNNNNSWLGFSLSPHMKMELTTPSDPHTHSYNNSSSAAAPPHPHTPTSFYLSPHFNNSSEFFYPQNPNPPSLSVMPLKSDGSLCIMEALSRSQTQGPFSLDYLHFLFWASC